MNRDSIRLAVVFISLIVVGVIARFVFLATPNFAATAAVATFAGFYFASRRVAMLVPIAVMAISNLWLDSYASWGVMLVVYASFLFPALLSHEFSSGRRSERRIGTVALGVCAVAPSLLFFVTTNLAVWAFNGYYAHTAAGLVQCYVQALPFYGFNVAGDLLCTTAIFGTFFFARWYALATVSDVRAVEAIKSLEPGLFMRSAFIVVSNSVKTRYDYLT